MKWNKAAREQRDKMLKMKMDWCLNHGVNPRHVRVCIKEMRHELDGSVTVFYGLEPVPPLIPRAPQS